MAWLTTRWRRDRWVLVGGVVIMVALLVAAIDVRMRPPAADPPSRPLSQWLFTVQVRNAQDRVDAGNAITLVSARLHRDRALCKLLGSRTRHVHGWVGTVHGIGTVSDDGEITVNVGDDVDLHTTATSLLKPGSPVFESVADLHDGDRVVFGGSFLRAGDQKSCVKARNILARTKVTSPDFDFRFTSVARARR